MSDNAEKNTNVGSGMQTIFDIQVCSADGQLLRQYTLTRQDNNVATLGAAEQRARMNLSDYHGDPLVIIVSMETLTKLRQVQIKVGSDEPRDESKFVQPANVDVSRHTARPGTNA